MSDETWPPVAGTDAELSAYLAGELDDLAARRLEARLADDPELAGRLDRLADTLVELRGIDEVDVPDGLADRVQAHVAASLHTEAAEPTEPVAASPAEATATGWASRLRRSPARLGAVAAAIAAVALVGGITLLGAPAGDEVAEDAAGELSALDRDADAPEEPPDVAEDAPEAEEAPEALEAPDDDAADSDVADPRAADPRDRVASPSAVAQGESLLGMPAGDAQVTADEQWAALEEGPSLRDGSDPTVCRAALPRRDDDVVVPVAVEAGMVGGRDVVVHLVAVGSDGPLDRLEVVTVDLATCDVVDRQRVPAP